MIHTKLWCESPVYRCKFRLDGLPSTDRPLIAQVCGSEIESVVQTCLEIQDYCDGIDLNCGCPQSIAKRGNYGAFLLEQEDVLLNLIKALVPILRVPLSVKVRLLPADTRDESIATSLDLYERLVEAGVHMLTIHGRTRHHKGIWTGAADWEAIRLVVEALGDRIPIIANGSVGNLQDAIDLQAYTKCDAVMSAEGLLEYPPLFSGLPRIGRLDLAREYMQLSLQYPPNVGGQGSRLKCIRMHMHRLLHADMKDDAGLRRMIVTAESRDDLEAALDYLQAKHKRDNHQVATEDLSWYMRHRVCDERTLCRIEAMRKGERTVRSTELIDDAADCFAGLFAEA
jgi:tRNA-dihydrouridine synthase